MAVTSGFFDAIDHDRTYNAEDMGSLFDGIIKDGILNSYGSHFATQKGSALDITVGSGKGWFKNTWIKNDDNLVLYADANTSGAVRIDTLVIDVDKRDSVRANNILIVKGSTSAPVLINEAAHKQYPLYDIYLDATGTTINHLVDRRTESYASYLLSEQLRPYWPIGAIYMSVSPIEPSTLFGGTWERLTGRFLLGTDSGTGGSQFPSGSTDGSWNFTIRENHLPSHRHELRTYVTMGTATADIFTYRITDGAVGSTFMSWVDSAKKDKTDNQNENYAPPDWDALYGYTGAIDASTLPGMGRSPGVTSQLTIAQNGHSHSIGGYTDYTGSGQAIDIKPPYLAVYMWKRTG